MGTFGQQLKELLQITNIKYSSLSNILNFDSSYISKWITTGLLPSDKNASEICYKISAFFDQHSDAATKQNIYNTFHIASDETNLSNALYHILHDAYLEEAKQKKVTGLPQKQIEVYEDVFTSSTENRDKLIKSIKDYRKESDTIHLYIIGDILDSYYSDLIFLMDVKYALKELQFKEIYFDFYLAKDSILSKPNDETAICFLNLILIELKANVNYYHVDIQHSGLILYIKDYIVYQAHFLLNNEWLLSHCSSNEKRLAYYNALIANDIKPIGRRLLSIFDYNEIYDFNNLLQIYNCKTNKILLGVMDTTLFDFEFLTLLFSMADAPNALVDNWLKKHKIFESLMKQEEQIQILIYSGAMDDFVYNGHIKLANQDFYISVKHRVQAIECVLYIMETYKNVHIQFINNFLVNEIKHPTLPNLYLGKNSAHSFMFPRKNRSRFVAITNPELLNYFHLTFDSIWEGNLGTLLDGHKVLKEYASICREILSFELMI